MFKIILRSGVKKRSDLEWYLNVLCVLPVAVVDVDFVVVALDSAFHNRVKEDK